MCVAYFIVYIWIRRCNLCDNEICFINLPDDVCYDKARTISLVGSDSLNLKFFTYRLHNFHIKLIVWGAELHNNKGTWRFIFDIEILHNNIRLISDTTHRPDSEAAVQEEW